MSVRKKSEVKKNKQNQNSKKNTKQGQSNKNVIIVISTILILLLVVLFVIFAPRLREPFAGKAVEYGVAVSGALGVLGISITDISAGAPWIHSIQGTKNDIIEVTGFVNFAGTTGTFGTMRLKLNFDPTVLEPIDIIPLHNKYQSQLGSNLIQNDYVIIYYTWSGAPGDLATWSMTGQSNLFKVRFKVIADNPGDGNSQVYQGVNGAAWLEQMSSQVLNDDSGTSFGIYRTASGNDNVQMVEAIPNPQSITLTVYPGCEDEDGDSYAPSGKDKQACGGGVSDDCNDNEASVNPNAIESCNGVDDDCTGTVDDGLGNAPFNDPVVDGQSLAGVCFGYKVCDSQNAKDWVNSYEFDAVGTNYNSVTDDCDFFDNDCDGELNEDAVGCQIGECNGQAQCAGQIAGNLYLKIPYVEGEQEVSLTDLTNNYLISNFYSGLEETRASCSVFGTGYLCVCKNGNYYKVALTGDVVSAVRFIDYEQHRQNDLDASSYTYGAYEVGGYYYGLLQNNLPVSCS